MKHWYQSLSVKDQRVLRYGTLICLLILLYVGIWAPLSNATDKLKKQNAYEQELLTWMKAAKVTKQHTHNKQKLPPTSLATTISQSIQQSQLKTFIADIKQNNESTLELQFTAVPYVSLLKWLTQLEQRYQLEIKQCFIQATKTAGMVKVELQLASS